MAAEEQELDRMFRDKIVGLNSTIDAFESNAYGSDLDGGELASQRAKSLDAFAAKNLDPAPQGRSQVVDWTVFETIQWILPSLTRIFAAGDKIVEFEPFGPEDEDAAEQESEYLNHLVTTKNDWFLTCLTWFQDALLTKNAYCMASIEEKIDTEIITYKGQSEEQVALILDDKVELVGQNQYEDEDSDPEPVPDPLTGEQAIDPFTGEPVFQLPILFDIQIRRTEPKQKLQFKVLPPERCLIDQNCDDYTLERCDYFEYWDNVTLSELRSMGYEVEDQVGSDADFDTLEDTSRDENLGTDNRRQLEPPEASLRQVKARWIWVRHDFDEDGIAELMHVVRVGNDVLEMDTVSTIPVASIVPFLNTHRHIGMSVADLVFDIQQIKTDLLRQGIDNLRFSNNPREFFSKKVNHKALMLSRPGAKIEVETSSPDVAGHVFTSKLPFVFPEAQAGLQHMDTVVESRVGVNRIFQGIDTSNINDHNRIGQLSTMAAQRVEQIARIFGNGVMRLFKIGHELVIKTGQRADKIKLRGEWVEFDPRQWKTGRDMRVVAPFAAGNKDSLLQRLLIHMQIHEKALAAGLPMVTQDDSYELALDISKATDTPGDRYYTDPKTIPPPPEQPDPTLVALEIENKNADNKALDDQLDAQVELEKIASAERIAKYQTDVKAEVDLLIAQARGENIQGVEKLKAQLRDRPVMMANESIEQNSDNVRQLAEALTSTQTVIEQLGERVSSLQEDLFAPVQVVRDDSGKITGKQVNGRFVPLSEA